MCTRKIMVGTIFAGGCASCFHLTAYSVRRPPRPSLEGSEVIFESGAGIRILQCRQSLTARRRTIERGICLPLRCNGFSRVEQASQPRIEVRRATGARAPSGSLALPICHDVREVEEEPRG